jgi:hypothetical protein
MIPLSKNISRKGPRNCRSLGFARDDKGKGNRSIKSGCLLSEAALHGSAALPFVVSTEAQRSGETSVLTSLPGNVFRQTAA